MPVPALIAGGLALTGAAASSAATSKMNRRSQKFQEMMFDKTNKYNSPVEQMKRLKAAGLNPHLVYGGSSGGTAGTASQPAKPDFNTPDYASIGAQMGEGVMNYYNAKQIQAGIDVNEERSKNIRQDTINKGIEAVNKAIKNAQGALDYKTKSRLFDTTIKTAEQNLKNLGIQGQYQSNQDRRADAITQETVRKLRAETSKLSEEAMLKRIDRELYEQYKIRPQDPFYMRIFPQIMDELNLENPFKN